jgi:hypothetical protein
VRDGAEQTVIHVALAVFALAASPSSADGPRLVHDATVAWSEPVAGFGGFSAMEITDDGRGFVALTDRGHWATGRLRRTDGRLTGASLAGFGPLRAISGDALSGRDADAEAIALGARGRAFVAFEAFHRVRRYDRIDGPATDVAAHPGFPRLQRNSGLEALAVDADGTLYAIPERSGAWERPFPVFRFRGGVWDTALSIPRSDRFLPAGADFGPDGRLYLVERDFRVFGGFRTRVRRFDLGPEGFSAGETLLETGWAELDNMEAISVWADAEGRTRLTLMSDDNFFPLQRTIFAEYLLAEPG